MGILILVHYLQTRELRKNCTATLLMNSLQGAGAGRKGAGGER